MKTIILLAILGLSKALHCNKALIYYERYGYGFEITCQNISSEKWQLLGNTTIYNDISLRIENSILENFTSKMFKNVQNIRHLSVENSIVTFSKVEPIFQELKILERLVIENTNFYINKYTFLEMSSLKQLILTNTTASNWEKDTFKSLSNLEYLELRDNKIADFGEIPICELKDLRVLNVSRNSIQNLSSQHFFCQKSDSVMDFNLNNEDHILNIKDQDYLSISDYSSKITSLDLSFNNLEKIGGSLNNLKFLEVLKLQGNALSKINKSDVGFLHALKELHLSNNSLVSVDETSFEGKDYLEFLDLSRNKLKYLVLENLPRLKYLNLADNELDDNILRNISSTESLQILSLGNNKLVNMETQILQKFLSLTKLDVSDNRINFETVLFAGLKKLRHLSIRNNSIDALSYNIFIDLNDLRTLDLSRNIIKYFHNDKVFRSLSNLEILNISNNLLESLSYGLIEPLVNLKVLDLAGNQLNHIEYQHLITKLPLLSELNVINNHLTCEFLLKMANFLRHERITFVLKNKSYEMQNVAGMPCSNENSVITTASGTNSAGDSDTDSALENFGLLILTISFLIVTGLIVFKGYIFLKRRRYRTTEFELINE